MVSTHDIIHGAESDEQNESADNLETMHRPHRNEQSASSGDNNSNGLMVIKMEDPVGLAEVRCHLRQSIGYRDDAVEDESFDGVANTRGQTSPNMIHTALTAQERVASDHCYAKLEKDVEPLESGSVEMEEELQLVDYGETFENFKSPRKPRPIENVNRQKRNDLLTEEEESLALERAKIAMAQRLANGADVNYH